MTTTINRLGPGTLSFGESASLFAFEQQVTKCEIVPKVTTGSATLVLDGTAVPGKRTEACSIKGTILQDLGADKSIVEWTWKMRGKTVPFEFIPAKKGAKAVRGQCTIEAVGIGGETGDDLTTDFEFDCPSFPSLEDAAKLPN